MRERERIVVMNDPHAMRINKELAEEIGFQESIVFLQLEYLIANSGDIITGPDGVARRWKRLPLRDLQEHHFSWWSAATILRVLNRLQERNLILVGEHNELGYDRTQWYAIDEEGVRELHSVAIFQNEKSNLQNANQDVSDCKMQTDRMKNADLQNETTIRKEVSKEPKETSPKGDAKKSGTSPPRLRVKRLSDEEAEERFAELCRGDPHGESLRTLSELLAEENDSGQVQITKVWREIGERYLKKRSEGGISEEAWAYGFDQAISRHAPNIGYVHSAANGYRRTRRPAGAGAGAGAGKGVEDGADRQDFAGYTDDYEFLFGSD